MDLSAVTLNKGDTLIVTINSDNLTNKLVTSLKREFKKVFPKNKIAVIGVGASDRLALGVLTKGDLNV